MFDNSKHTCQMSMPSKAAGRMAQSLLFISLFLSLYAAFAYYSFVNTAVAVEESQTHQLELMALTDLYVQSEDANYWMLHFVSTSSMSSRKKAMKTLASIEALKDQLIFAAAEYEATLANIKISIEKLDKAHNMSSQGFDLVAVGLVMQAGSNMEVVRETLKDLKSRSREGMEESARLVEKLNLFSIIFAIGTLLVLILMMFLAKKVSDINRELKSNINLLENAQKKMVDQEQFASLGELVAGVAHEIKNPLGISVTAASMISDLLKALEKGIEDKQITSRAQMLESLHSMRDCNDLLTSNIEKASVLVDSFKKISVDQSSGEVRSFFLLEYLHQIIESTKFQHKKKNIDFEIDIDPNLQLTCVAGAWSQIFTNLIFNSVLHAFKDKEQGRIEITAAIEQEQLIIHYRDDGAGLSPDIQKHIFDMYFTTARESGGSGIGMHVVFKLISQDMEGHIGIAEDSEQGAHFIIRIPTRAVNVAS